MSDLRNSLPARVLRELSRGPMTNRQLQEALCAHGGEIARACSQLAHSGHVCRIDGKSGRGAGKNAIYARAA